MKTIKLSKDESKYNSDHIGYKAANILTILHADKREIENNCSIPAGFVISTHIFNLMKEKLKTFIIKKKNEYIQKRQKLINLYKEHKYIVDIDSIDNFLKYLAKMENTVLMEIWADLANEYKNIFRSLDEEIEQIIENIHTNIIQSQQTHFFVRSSSNLYPTSSLPGGIFKSKLHRKFDLEDREYIKNTINEIYESIFIPRSSYKEIIANGFDAFSMAIIFQSFISSRIGGLVQVLKDSSILFQFTTEQTDDLSILEEMMKVAENTQKSQLIIFIESLPGECGLVLNKEAYCDKADLDKFSKDIIPDKALWMPNLPNSVNKKCICIAGKAKAGLLLDEFSSTFKIKYINRNVNDKTEMIITDENCEKLKNVAQSLYELFDKPKILRIEFTIPYGMEKINIIQVDSIKEN